VEEDYLSPPICLGEAILLVVSSFKLTDGEYSISVAGRVATFSCQS
jgi:hypothetical protein